MKPLDLNNTIIKNDMDQIKKSNLNWGQLRGKSIFISGATGMIASYLTLFFIYLNESNDFGIKLYLNCRSFEKAKQRFGDYLKRDYIIVINRDIITKFEIKENINYIIHAASLASPQYYNVSPVETALPNIIGTYNLLEFAKEQHDFNGFLFFSSGSVYGNTTSMDGIKESDIGILDFLNNGNSYAESKRCGEMLCHAYWSEYKIPAKSVRIHHTYGPNMDYRTDKRVFSEFVCNCIDEKDIIIKSDGAAKRAFCYISDTISGLFFVLLNGENGESYNLGNPFCYYSIAELARLLVNISEQKNKVVFSKRMNESYCPSPESDLRNDPVNIEKIKGLGWNPIVSGELGFQNVLNYINDYDKR